MQPTIKNVDAEGNVVLATTTTTTIVQLTQAVTDAQNAVVTLQSVVDSDTQELVAAQNTLQAAQSVLAAAVALQPVVQSQQIKL